jgi:hypothetical protein
MRMASRWLELIEKRACARLRQARQRELWDGTPPVPIEFVLEHLLELRISWETIEEKPDEEILASIRPATREVVLNETHRVRFEQWPGVERFSLAHEAGHADIFAMVDRDDQIAFFSSSYRPQHRSATKGNVVALPNQLKGLPADMRTNVLRRLRDHERARWARGEDTPFERRSVDHYAAVILMPEELLRAQATSRDLGEWRTVEYLAQTFGVSCAAMRIRLEELGLIFGIDDDGQLLREDPAQRDQGSLF